MNSEIEIELDKLVISNNLDFKFCSYKDINWSKVIFCKAEGSYTRLFFENGKEIKFSKRIAVIYYYINSEDFFRCHRKFVVNISKIKTIQFTNHPTICLKNGIFIPIALRRKSSFKKIIGKYLLAN